MTESERNLIPVVIVGFLMLIAGYSAAKRKGRSAGPWALACGLLAPLLIILELLPSLRSYNDPERKTWPGLVEWAAILIGGFSVFGGISSQFNGDLSHIFSDPSEVTQSHAPSVNTPSVETVFILSERPAQNRIIIEPFNSDGIQQSCNEEWTKRGVPNYEMINYCVSRQKDGYQKLKLTVSKIGGYSWGQDLYESELNEWTKRGVVNYEELNYIIDREYDCFLNLVYDFTHGSLNRSAFNQSLDEWSNKYIQWSQVEYSYKRLTGTD